MNLPTYSIWSSEPGAEDKWGFRIEEGKYEGVYVKINDVIMKEDDTTVTVDFDAISANKEHPEEFSTSEEFQAVFSLIINKILEEAIKAAANDENRTDHP